MGNWIRRRAEEVSEILVTFYILCFLFFVWVFAGFYNVPLGSSLDVRGYITILPVLAAAALYVARKLLAQVPSLGAPRVDEILLLVVVLPLAAALLWHSHGYEGAKVVLIVPAVVSGVVLGPVWGTLVAALAGSLVFWVDYRALGGISPEVFRVDAIVLGVTVLLAWLVASLIRVERRTQAELATLADRDPLTGLLNDRRLLEALGRSLAEAGPLGSPVALLLLDLDQFRHYNARLGFQRGDEMLTLMAEVVKRALPAGAYAARSGGARFAVVLPKTAKMEAVEVGEDLCLQAEQVLKEYLARQEPEALVLRPAVNYGLAVYPTDAAEAGALYQAADDDLFRVKYSRGKSYLYKSILGQLDTLRREDAFGALQAFVALVNLRDRYTFGHSERVVVYTLALADKLGLSEEDKTVLRHAAYLHDIGKLEVPHEILTKPGRLDDEEWEVMKRHPVWGSEMLGVLPAFRRAAEAVRSHHENYDGSGYPDGLQGESISLLARIIRLADSFDAMTSSRPYRRALTTSEALQEIIRSAGTLYDPQLVPAFVGAVRERERAGLLA